MVSHVSQMLNEVGGIFSANGWGRWSLMYHGIACITVRLHVFGVIIALQTSYINNSIATPIAASYIAKRIPGHSVR